MSQEYTEDKEVTLSKLSSGRRLLEALLIVIALFAVWLMAALLSFNPSDPSWSQTAWHEPIHNLGGERGRMACRYPAFYFRCDGLHHSRHYYWRMLVCLASSSERHDYIDYFAVSLRLIGALALILTSCGLAAINADDIWYFASGGVIGSLLSSALQPMLQQWRWHAGAALHLGGGSDAVYRLVLGEHCREDRQRGDGRADLCQQPLAP